MFRLLVDYAGRLHPLVIHFPIGLLLIGAGGEVMRLWSDRDSLGRFVRTMILLGAAGVLCAAATGWLFAYQIHRPPELRPLMFRHRWLGIATAGTSIIAAFVADRWINTPSSWLRWVRRTVICGNAILLAVTAHLGAALVWGSDFFS